eukprot:6482290-Amphidinium_carterae.4
MSLFEACQEKALLLAKQMEQGLEALERHAHLHILLAQDLCVCSVVVFIMFGTIIVLAAVCGVAFAQEALVESGSQPGVVAVLFPNVTTEQEKRRAEVAFDRVYEAFNQSFNESWQPECLICPSWRSLRVRADAGMRSTIDLSMSHCDKGSSQVVCTCVGKSDQNSYTFAFGLSARL